MQERVKTSFIPKASLKTARTDSVRRSTVGVVNVAAGALLIAAIIAAGALFLFEQYVQAAINTKRESLTRARAAFQPETIKELSRLDTRLSVGASLLAAHTAPSRLFDFIERETLSTVRFRNFAYAEAGPGRMTLVMSGEAASFNAVALQSDAFGATPLFSEVIFSNLNIDLEGKVVFDFSAVVSIDEITYQAGAAAAQPSGEVPVTEIVSEPEVELPEEEPLLEEEVLP